MKGSEEASVLAGEANAGDTLAAASDWINDLRFILGNEFRLLIRRFIVRTRRIEHLDPRSNEMAIVVIGATTDHVPINHTRLVDVNTAAHFEIELALCYCRHA